MDILIVYDKVSQQRLIDGYPCLHVGCLSHASHPCEVCGRVGGYADLKNDRYERVEEPCELKCELCNQNQATTAIKNKHNDKVLRVCRECSDWVLGGCRS